MRRWSEINRVLDRGVDRALSNKLVCFVGGPVLMWGMLQSVSAGIGLNRVPDERSWQRYEKVQVAAQQLESYAKQMERVPVSQALDVLPALNAVAGFSRAECMRTHESITPMTVGRQDYAVDVPKYITCIRSNGQNLALSPTPTQTYKLTGEVHNYMSGIGGLVLGLTLYRINRREVKAKQAQPS